MRITTSDWRAAATPAQPSPSSFALCRGTWIRALQGVFWSHRSRLRALVVLGGLLAVTVPASAQVPVTAAGPAAPTDEQKRRAFIEGQVTPIAGTDPEGAIRATKAFLGSNAQMHLWERSLLIGTVSNALYYEVPSDKRHQNAKAVLALLDEGIAQTSPATAWPQNSSQVMLQKLAVSIALDEDLLPDAQRRLESVWPLALDDWAIVDYTRLRGSLLTRLGEEKEIAPMLSATLTERLQHRQQLDVLLCQQMVEALRGQGQDAQALSWAKLYFMLCPFEQGAIGQATQTLAQTWLAQDLSPAKAQAFGLAQSAADKPNPLREVPLPAFPAPLSELVKTSAGKAKVARDYNALVTLLLVQGDYHGAMMQARAQLTANPGSQEGVLQVARVFKARDLNLTRANAFLAYYQSGQGANPLTAFLQENAPVAPATQ